MQAIEELEDLTEYIKENKEKYYGFIYVTTNLINGKKYIGQKNIDKRYKWGGYLGSGVHLSNSIKKYGRDNFKRVIIDIAKSKKELNEKEKNWIFKYDCVNSDDYYNMIEGGQPTLSTMPTHYVACLCLGTDFVFKSVAEASKWSGYPESYIKRSFDTDYSPFKNDRYIFRRLGYFKPSEKLCSCCGRVVDKYRVKISYCKYCAKKIGDINILENVECEYNKSVHVYSIKDKAIKEYLSFHNKEMIAKRERKEELKRMQLFEFETLLDNNKESISHWYFKEKIPSTSILSLLGIKDGRKNKELKLFLEKLQIKKEISNESI